MSHGDPLGQFPALCVAREAYRDRTPPAHPDNRTVMGTAEAVASALNSAVDTDDNLCLPFVSAAGPASVAIGERISRIVERLEVAVDRIGIVVGVAPSERRGEPGSDVGGAENGESIDVHSLVAAQVNLVALSPAKEADVGIEQHHRPTGDALRGGDRPHVRALIEVDWRFVEREGRDV